MEKIDIIVFELYVLQVLVDLYYFEGSNKSFVVKNNFCMFFQQ